MTSCAVRLWPTRMPPPSEDNTDPERWRRPAQATCHQGQSNDNCWCCPCNVICNTYIHSPAFETASTSDQDTCNPPKGGGGGRGGGRDDPYTGVMAMISSFESHSDPFQSRPHNGRPTVVRNSHSTDLSAAGLTSHLSLTTQILIREALVELAFFPPGCSVAPVISRVVE